MSNEHRTFKTIEESYDLVVLGAGIGGYIAAIRGAQLGASVALIEKETIGGTCLNHGCIPTKTLIKNAKILIDIEMARARGIHVGRPTIDMDQMITAKDEIVAQLVAGVEGVIKSNNIEVIRGKGKVENNNRVSIDSGSHKGKNIAYKKLIIATGSSPKIPSIPGVLQEGILTNREILAMREIPKHLVIIGGGVLGVEFATIYAALGSKVTIVAATPRLVRKMDKDISQVLYDTLTKKGVRVLLDSKVELVEKQGENFVINLKGQQPEKIKGDKVLISIGRKPNFSSIENSSLKTENKGIIVNSRMETNVQDIYAIGDVTGEILLAHVASTQGIIAAENAMGASREMDYRFVPNCIYTLPEIAAVGLTEEQARANYKNVSVGKFPMTASGKALTMGETQGMVKVISETKYGEILGVHILGPNATEIIAEATAFMQLEGTIEELIHTIHAHPTMAETILEAAHVAGGEPIHLPKKEHNMNYSNIM